MKSKSEKSKVKRWKLENGGPSICEYIIYFSIFLFVNYDYDYDNSPHSPWLRLGMHCRTTERRGEVARLKSVPKSKENVVNFYLILRPGSSPSLVLLPHGSRMDLLAVTTL